MFNLNELLKIGLNERFIDFNIQFVVIKDLWYLLELSACVNASVSVCSIYALLNFSLIITFCPDFVPDYACCHGDHRAVRM